MRFAFGLGGLLVVVGVIVWIMGAPGGELDQAKSAIDARNKVEPQIKQWSGKGEDGTPAQQSATLQAQTDNSGKLRGLLVADIVPDGAYAKHYGLKQYDLIVQVGPMDVRTMDEGMATSMMLDSYTRSQEIVVIRGNERVTLPQSASATANPAAPAGSPAAPTAPKSKGIQGQLEGIQGIPTH